METILVTEENSEKVAEKLIKHLRGYHLYIVSLYVNKFFNPKESFKRISGVMVTGDYSVKNGVLKIDLSPNRKIRWDVVKENVTLIFNDDGTVEIVRIVTATDVIKRVIVRCCSQHELPDQN